VSTRLLAASNNAHKLREFERILAPLGITVVTPEELGLSLEVEETGTTFAENALIKARAFASASGMPAVADDSGLVVDALGGEPGVYSARYGGLGLDDAGRTQLVLERMAAVPPERRTARFVSAIALAGFSPGEPVFVGVVEGVIARKPEGANGFGYDPIFYYPPLAATFGQAPPEAKDTVSHRARALAQLDAYLRSASHKPVPNRDNGRR
jgi:XTP/dITP diphosphohydrolase